MERFTHTTRERVGKGLTREVAAVAIEYVDDFSGDALITVKYFGQPSQTLRLPAEVLRRFALRVTVPQALAALQELIDHGG